LPPFGRSYANASGTKVMGNIKSGYIGMIKKPLQAQRTQSQRERGNLKNSDTNRNDITHN